MNHSEYFRMNFVSTPKTHNWYVGEPTVHQTQHIKSHKEKSQHSGNVKKRTKISKIKRRSQTTPEKVSIVNSNLVHFQ